MIAIALPHPLRLFRLAAVAIAAMPLCGRSLSAQTTIPGITGMVMRYHGDTIWRERDTTMSRVVFRGDTVIRTMYVHGKSTGTMTYVLSGDDALLVQNVDGDGKPRTGVQAARSAPALAVIGERQLLESAITSRGMQERMSGMGIGMPGNDAPVSPTTVQTYAMSANRNLVQHGDTVRYITGCQAVGHADTTVYVLFANDSLKRLTPDARTFGPAMVAAVRADMGGVLLRQRVRDPADFAALPGPRKWPCDRR